MSDAQKEILKMLSDNVITVDEAERLLKALHEGEKHKGESKSRAGGARSMGVGGVFELVGEALAEIGPLVKNTMEDVITGLFGNEAGDLNEKDLKDVEPIEGKYRIEEGTQMLIMNTWNVGHDKVDLDIQGIKGNFCRVRDEHSKHVKVQQDSSHFVIRWSGGPLKVEVPETVSMLKVRIKGGNICTKRIGCKINIKIFGGNLEMLDLGKDFKAKTLGGNINLFLSKEWQGNGQVHTQGGNIALSIPASVSLQAESSTMGGAITLDKEIRQVESNQFFPGRNSVKAQVGEEETDSFITLKTIGGDIELRKEHDE